MLIKSGSLAVANVIRYVFQRRVEGKQQLERINQLTPERADIETDSDSPTSPMSEHRQLEEPSRTVNDVLRHPPTNQPQVLPKNAKMQFYRLLREHKVCNSKHYDTLLTTNSYLRKIEESLNPNLLQTCKPVAFNQNLLFDKPSYIERILSLIHI